MIKNECEKCKNISSLYHDNISKILGFYENPHKEFYGGIVLYMKDNGSKNEVSYVDIVYVKDETKAVGDIHLKIELKCSYGNTIEREIFSNNSINYEYSESNEYIKKIMNIINDNNFKIKFTGFLFKINNKKLEKIIIKEEKILIYKDKKLEKITTGI